MISAGTCPVEPAFVSQVLKEMRNDVVPKSGSDWQMLAGQQIDFYAGELVYGNPFPLVEDVEARAGARRYLRTITGIERIYSSILANAEKVLTKPQRLADLAPNYTQVLRGQAEVSTVFTLEGWKFLEKASKERNPTLLGESCVIGEGPGAPANIKQDAEGTQAIQQLFVRPLAKICGRVFDRSI